MHGATIRFKIGEILRNDCERDIYEKLDVEDRVKYDLFCHILSIPYFGFTYVIKVWILPNVFLNLKLIW